ncbi:glycosyltransferase family 2 protein [Aurantimonas sp. MSK8Z-1]|uniref:glycosyltransferase family 2 protein n=1 Tax=Mangrovibrevibacter kandeliae TaxID=2968473 RepID=UPI002119AB45|nr:glycosyltransferase family 2 protein [Aurantimonas sp. MSK8Z-1]MCW4114849.1 glycosyltransferase family 2 protein [Aurantimonas sp. MSK8Z-1]
MQYPVADPADWNKVGRLSPLDRLRLAFRDVRFHRRARSRDGIELHQVNASAQPLAPDAIVLLCVGKDIAKHLPSFLAHYRRLGVARFAFVDDQSSDATPQILRAAPDVDVYRSNVGFRQASGGLLWRDMLLERYGRHRWYVSIDSDEYLVFPGCESRPLAAFIADLNRSGRTRAMAAMLDIYADGPIGDNTVDVGTDAFPTAVSPLYDGTGYRLTEERFCTAVRGGPRYRLFGTDMRLTKFPVVYADRALQFAGGSHHGPLPITRNFSPVQCVLLHHKLTPDAVEDFARIAASGSHYNGSVYYKRILDHGAFGSHTDFRFEGSQRYLGSEALVAAGFMQDLR